MNCRNADQELANKNYREAILQYNELIKKKINCTDNYHKRAQCFLALRINKNGFDDAQAAIDLNPKFSEAFVTLIKCCITINDLQTATTAIDNLLKLDPKNEFAKEYKPKVNQLKPLYAEVQQEMEGKNYLGALKKIEECITLMKGYNSFYKNEKIRILIYNEKNEEAEEIINEMLFASKIDVEAIQLRALLLWHKGKDVLAIRELELAEKLNKYLGGYQITSTVASKLHMQCHFMKYAANKYEAKEYETAIKFFKESIKQDVHNKVIAKQAHFKLAQCYDKLNQQAEAQDQCNKCLKIDETNKEVLEWQATFYKRTNQVKEAERTVKKILEKDNSEKYRNFLKEIQTTNTESKAKNMNGEDNTDWEILGIQEDATLKQVQEAFRKMAKLYHTDQHVGKDEATKNEYRTKMEQVNHAKENMEKRIKQKTKAAAEAKAEPPVERQ